MNESISLQHQHHQQQQQPQQQTEIENQFREYFMTLQLNLNVCSTLMSFDYENPKYKIIIIIFNQLNNSFPKYTTNKNDSHLFHFSQL